MAILLLEVLKEKLDGWIFNSKKFTGPDSGNIRLQLSGSDASGNAYIDDIKISPVLLVADGDDDKNSVYAAEACRLYPKKILCLANIMTKRLFASRGIRLLF
jgi:hypothetical protein